MQDPGQRDSDAVMATACWSDLEGVGLPTMTIFHAHILRLENTGDGRKHLELRQTTSNPGTMLSLLGGSFQRLNS